jgi:alpha-mannosidase
VLGTWENFQQKELSQPLLMAFGFGDGGGGPTAEMLENLDTLANFPAAPRVRQDSVKNFFEEVEARCGDQLPTWNGELYLELHRGTFTSQSRTKRLNRQSEFRLHDAEFLAAYAARLDPAYPYPAADLNRAWELVCLNQFHDIIPGSSIGQVYYEAEQQYAEVRRLAEGARDSAWQVLAGQTGGDVLVANPTSFSRCDLVFVDRPVEGLSRPDGTPVATQPVEGGTLLDLGELPPYSVTPLLATPAPAPARPSRCKLSASPAHLENAYLRVELDPAGDITRLYDKPNQREVLPPGALANQLQAFEDRPLNWDAWDIDIFYDDRMWLSEPAESIGVVESGPLRTTLEVKRRILHSQYTQRISLVYNSPRLDIATVIDWQERHILLKAAFPVEVLAPQATYEIQWGNVQRPTHRNTSWDWARFETCAHKWADLSEGGYGVSLLNDCKYGHDIHGNVIRLSLLRSPTAPDPMADLGEHRFTYSLLPHAGGWGEETVRQAYALNDPLLVWTADHPAGTGLRPLAPLVSCPVPNIVIETIKRAEDGDGLIVRLYECQRRRGLVTLQTAFPLQAAWVTDLLEENQQELAVEGDRLTLPVRPFQIVTLRLK